MSIRRWLYGECWPDFLLDSDHAILGELTAYSQGDVEVTQRNAWAVQIAHLKGLKIPSEYLASAKVYFEFTVPRLGRRVDVVLLIGTYLFIVEYKVGETSVNRTAIEQVWDYALDFKNFHQTSHSIPIAPILVPTGMQPREFKILETIHKDGLLCPIAIAPSQLSEVVYKVLSLKVNYLINVESWELGRYLPTPTIVEAARALYAGHAVENISRSDAGAMNLTRTTNKIDWVIDHSRSNHRKAICFVTGVPGAGKTLVGLDIANRHLDHESATYSVFLSGNGPLVAVLREALARDRVDSAKESGVVIRKGVARKEVESFIQNVHHFRDEYLKDTSAPPEHVVLFDEAQRAWNLEQTRAFMQQKKGRSDFNFSEPAFLMSCLDRHQDWAVVVCLVGSGQEINTGEGGIVEWFNAILNNFTDWDVYLSPNLAEAEFQGGETFNKIIAHPKTFSAPDLHLSTSMRSFRAENLSRFIGQVLSLEMDEAKKTFASLDKLYPIILTRDLQRAKLWLQEQARGTERYGLVVSSQAERLKPFAIDVRVKTDPVKWFLDDRSDIRSSFYMEDVATEFQVQGLELDWVCVVWDGDLRINGSSWSHHQFRGTRWNRINKVERQRYLENAYRVLLTRARQGMVIVVPEGVEQDPTRASEFYDPTYNYLRSLGLNEM
jgi:hypothetical protein